MRSTRTVRAVIEELRTHEQLRTSKKVMAFLGSAEDSFENLTAFLVAFRSVVDEAGIAVPVYDILDDYSANAVPSLEPLPARPVAQGDWTLFGRQIGLPIGVSASVLTRNSAWVRFCGANGFNVITYKTVRSEQRDPNPAPSWILLSEPQAPYLPSVLANEELAAVGVDRYWPKGEASLGFSTANSFGVPSEPPESWAADVRAALASIEPDQVLIVSVMGDIDNLQGEDLVEDYVRVALAAEKAGAKIVELNVSCPNVPPKPDDDPKPPPGKDDPKPAPEKDDPNPAPDDYQVHGGGRAEPFVSPPLCLAAPDVTEEIVRRVHRALNPETSLVAKLSYLTEAEVNALLPRLVPHLDGIAGINTLQLPTLLAEPHEGHSRFAFGDRRSEAGVSGIAIQELARDFVRSVVSFKRRTRTEFEILAMGGVFSAEDAARLYSLGASCVQVATSALFERNLAEECVRVAHLFPEREVESFDDEVVVDAFIEADVSRRRVYVDDGDEFSLIDASNDAVAVRWTVEVQDSEVSQVLADVAGDWKEGFATVGSGDEARAVTFTPSDPFPEDKSITLVRLEGEDMAVVWEAREGQVESSPDSRQFGLLGIATESHNVERVLALLSRTASPRLADHVDRVADEIDRAQTAAADLADRRPA